MATVADTKPELVQALDGLTQTLMSARLIPVQAADMSVAEHVQQFATDWGGVLGLVFMGAIVYVLGAR